MTVVIDASFVVAALIDSDADGRWAERLITSDHLGAPHLLPAEVTNVLRRAVMAGAVTSDVASLAFADLGELRIEWFAFEPFAERVWELRHNVSAYDAWYIAVAEALDAPLATLDARLAHADGPRCQFITPP